MQLKIARLQLDTAHNVYSKNEIFEKKKYYYNKIKILEAKVKTLYEEIQQLNQDAEMKTEKKTIRYALFLQGL